jgi:hypothetical protein
MNLAILPEPPVPASPRFSAIERQMREVRENLDEQITVLWHNYRAELRWQRGMRAGVGLARSEAVADVLRTQLLYLFNLRHTAAPRLAA